MNKRFLRPSALLLIFVMLLSGCAARQGLNMRAEDAKIQKGIELPVNVSLGIYVPDVQLEQRFYVKAAGAWVTPGAAMRAALETVSAAYFGQYEFIDPVEPSDNELGLVAALKPEWDFESGKISLTLDYRIYDAAGALLKEGTATRAKPIGNLHDSSGFYNAALKTAQIVAAETINTVFANGAGVDTRVAASAVDSDLLVNMDKPIRTGTAFFVSDKGDLLTAAHVTDGCLRTQIEFEGSMHPVQIEGQSVLLDVALLRSDVATDKYLTLREDPNVVLGERVSAAGFPLQTVLANSANLTVGNVSSLEALPGSLGKFQFSAPVQPGSSGGPVVSEQGELIGMTTGSLNVNAMIERGVLPQNVNFALEGQYLAKFAERHAANVRPSENHRVFDDVAAVNEHLAASVAQIACYQ